MKTRKGMWILLAALAIFFAHGVAVADESCQYCGMKKSMYGHSWVVITHEDGTSCGLCSVHCAAIDMALHVGKPVASVTVGDYNTQEQIDAERAYWVIGGDRMGVMTARAKWAFKTKEAADKFMNEHSGSPATYEEVLKASFEDMYEDTLMIQKKLKMRQGQESH